MRIRYPATALAFTAVLAAGTITAGVAAAPPPANCGWSLVATPPVPGDESISGFPPAGASIVTPAYGALNGVDVLSGSDVRITGNEVFPALTGWLLQADNHSLSTAAQQFPQPPLYGPLPAGPQAFLATPVPSGASFDSTADGWVLSGQIGPNLVAEHWQHGRWTVVQMATLSGARDFPQFFTKVSGLVAVSPSDAWAVGGLFQGLALLGTVIEHWDGTSWQIVSQPLADEAGALLNGISAVSPGDVWAIGEERNDAGVLVPISEHWNGSTWTQVPVPAGNDSSDLAAASGTGPDDVWATGAQTIPGSDGAAEPMIEHWDGTAWHLAALPDLGNSKLTAIYAASPNDAWAVGTFALGLTQVFLHWNGHSWTPVAVPGPQRYFTSYTYTAIDGDGAGNVWAVGRVDDSGNQTTHPVAAHLGCRS